MEALQTRRFAEQVKEIIPTKFGQKLKFENGIVTTAQINTPTKLNAAQLNALSYMAHSWHFKNYEISRSGAGLKIEFIELNKAAVAALN
jgi:hypothetical protein